jgi:4a-hydroxytetrahydrobiopterin dehydratase
MNISKEEANKYMADVLGWELDAEGKKISKEFKFKDFKEAMEFVNKVADVANSEDHHPDIYIYYNKVKMDLSTHAIGGLSENDFIVAAKINHLLS